MLNSFYVEQVHYFMKYSSMETIMYATHETIKYALFETILVIALTETCTERFQKVLQ